MRIFSTILGLLLLLVSADVHAQSVRVVDFKIQEENRDFLISWKTEQEQGIRAFEIKRKTRYTNNEFVMVQSMPPHGATKPYLFRDTQVYKSGSEQVDYRLEVVYANGLREVLQERSLNYTSTAVRRTWGSIKAMFQ